jgi:uncharacterized protein YdeI (YjbR/CyaY-like superfamily)
MEPLFFAKPADFRRWLEKHHHAAAELLVGFYKRGSGRPSMTWPESVDEALCFGWIDGVRRSLDDESYTIRFTPRRPSSNWSLINIRKVEALIRDGRMKPAGLEAFEARDESKSGVYSFEQRENAKLDRKAEATFRANRAAWRFFQAQPPGYRKIAAFHVMSAKREETRAKRLSILIEHSAAGQRIGIQPRAREKSGK